MAEIVLVAEDHRCQPVEHVIESNELINCVCNAKANKNTRLPIVHIHFDCVARRIVRSYGKMSDSVKYYNELIVQHSVTCGNILHPGETCVQFLLKHSPHFAMGASKFFFPIYFVSESILKRQETN